MNTRSKSAETDAKSCQVDWLGAVRRRGGRVELVENEALVATTASPAGEVTCLLLAWKQGDREALEKLVQRRGRFLPRFRSGDSSRGELMRQLGEELLRIETPRSADTEMMQLASLTKLFDLNGKRVTSGAGTGYASTPYR
jgi:hypothetical protein